MLCTTGCRAIGPALLYPMLAILAADAFASEKGWRGWCSRLAMPVAGYVLLLAYAAGRQRLFAPQARSPGAVAGRRHESRLPARCRPRRTRAAPARCSPAITKPRPGCAFTHQRCRLSRSISPTAIWMPRWPRLGSGPWLYFADHARGNDRVVTGYFTEVAQRRDLARMRGGSVIARYDLWRLGRPKSPIQGRTP